MTALALVRRGGAGSLVAVMSAAILVSAPAASALGVPVASVTNATTSEGDSGTKDLVFTVTLSESNGTTTVDYTTVDNTATAGADFTATSGTLTFGPGETQKTIRVAIRGDLLDEADETFTLVLTRIENGTFQGGDPNGTGTITDDDPTPTISITDATVTEGNSGTTTTTVAVNLSAPSGRNISVAFATADGTATFDPGGDYHSSSGTLVFSPGETTKTLTLTVVSDTVDESNETFLVNLSSAVNATLSDPQAVVTIIDDDSAGQQPPGGSGPLPSISISDTTVTEGNSGTVQSTVTVSLSKASAEPVGVSFATADNTATFSGSDYHSQSGRLVFSPGETSKVITITVVGDTVDENNETYFINLTDAAGATISDGRAVITIIDDDSGSQPPPPPPSGTRPSISISDASVSEGNTDDTNVSVTVSLSTPSSSPVTVDFATTDGTALFADADYWRMSGRVVFAAGETARTLTATVVADLRAEPNEVFYLDLFNATNATLADARASIGIIDDDGSTSPGGSPVISVTDATVPEGAADTTSATLTFTLSQASSRPVSVDFGTTDGSATFDQGDYFETRGRIVFQPGETSQTLQIKVNGDMVAEGDEVFYVDLSNPVNASIGDARAVITIADDDAPSASRTTLVVRLRAGRLVARGTVAPPHPGESMRVLLKKHRNGRFRTIAVRRPVLSEAFDRDGDGTFESRYRTRFSRPGEGRCLLRAVFPGDEDHARSVARGTFRC